MAMGTDSSKSGTTSDSGAARRGSNDGSEDATKRGANGMDAARRGVPFDAAGTRRGVTDRTGELYDPFEERAAGEQGRDVVAMVSLHPDGTPAQSANYEVLVPEHGRPAGELAERDDLVREFEARAHPRPHSEPRPEPEPVTPAVTPTPASASTPAVDEKGKL